MVWGGTLVFTEKLTTPRPYGYGPACFQHGKACFIFIKFLCFLFHFILLEKSACSINILSANKGVSSTLLDYCGFLKFYFIFIEKLNPSQLEGGGWTTLSPHHSVPRAWWMLCCTGQSNALTHLEIILRWYISTGNDGDWIEYYYVNYLT